MTQKEIGRSLSDFVRISIEGTEQLTIKIVTIGDDGEVFKVYGEFTTKAIDGTFPDFRRVIPEDIKNACGVMAFDPAYLADFAKAAKLLGREVLQLQSTGAEQAILVNICEGFTGVLMPRRF